MASLTSLSSLCLSLNPNGHNSLRFTSETSPCFRFGSQNVHYPKANKFPRVRVPVCRVSSVIFPNLQADDFRHPLEKEITQRFKEVPDLIQKSTEIEEGVRGLPGNFAKQTRFSENICIGTSVLATPSQLSSLHELMAETADILNVKAPLLYVRSSPVPCARTVALNDTPYVVVHTSLLELLTLQELQAVFAHQLALLKCDHYLLLKLLDVFFHGDKLVLGVKGIPDCLISQSPLEEVVRLCSRWRQGGLLSYDRASLLVVQDPKVVISAMMKLASGSSSLIEELNVDAFLKQARAYATAFSSSPTGWYSDANAAKITYPEPVLRAYEIDEWSRSREYKMLLRSATNQCCKEVDAVKMKKEIMDDVEKNMEKVDAKKVMEQVVAEKIMEQVDAKKIMEQIVAEKIMDQVDVENLLKEVDIEQVAAKTLEQLGRSRMA